MILGHVGPLVGQCQRRLADDKMVPGPTIERVRLLAPKKDRIARVGQHGYVQAPLVPRDFDVLATDPLIPRYRPGPRRAADDDGRTRRKLAPPALVGLRALGDQVRHWSTSLHFP